ncbi:MAG TPA: glycosyltransferase family 4 protein [Herpetosiphonaceae bacterium]
MRIAQVAPLVYPTPPPDYGGIESFLALLVDSLIDRGHDVTLFGTGDTHTRARLHAIVDECLAAQYARGLASHRHEHYHNAAMATMLAHAADFDVIHCHLGCRRLPFSALSPTPILFTLHDGLNIDDRWVLTRYAEARVVAISRDQVRDLPHSRQERIPVIHHGCEFRAGYVPATERGDYLMFLGRMGPDKNPVDAIRIARSVGCRLVLAGGPTPWVESEQRYVAEQVAPHVDGEQIVHVGRVNLQRKRALLDGALALLFPVRWREPFGLVMVEAMEAGVPVLAYANGSVREVIDEGVTGYLGASVEDLAALVPAALRLDRQRLRSHAASRFSLDRMVSEYEALYRSVVR